VGAATAVMSVGRESEPPAAFDVIGTVGAGGGGDDIGIERGDFVLTWLTLVRT
jgi:hypothetical protein